MLDRRKTNYVLCKAVSKLLKIMYFDFCWSDILHTITTIKWILVINPYCFIHSGKKKYVNLFNNLVLCMN